MHLTETHLNLSNPMKPKVKHSSQRRRSLADRMDGAAIAAANTSAAAAAGFHRAQVPHGGVGKL